MTPAAPPCEPGAYVTTLGRVVVVLDVGAEVCVRVGEKSREWWSHKRWRATMVGARREEVAPAASVYEAPGSVAEWKARRKRGG